MPARTLRYLSIASLLLAAGLDAGRAADPVVYSQPYSVGAYTTWASCTSGDGYATGYDNFTLAAQTSVTAVQWRGNYAARNPADNPIAPDVASFSISFYADDAGQPGALLASGTVDLADCNAQSYGTVGLTYDDNDPTSYQVPFVGYRAVLPTPFAASPGQKYWLSIVANTTTQDLWGWYSGSGGDQSSIQDFNGRITRPLDRTFALEGIAATPTVGVAVTAKTADANAGTPGVFTLSLPAPAAAKLKVKYTLGGTAVNGTDYSTLSGKAVFKPGQSSVDVQVVPTTPPVGVPFTAYKKTVTLAVQPGTGYVVGEGAKPAKIKIVRSAGIILP